MATLVPLTYPINDDGVLITTKPPAARLAQQQSATLELVMRDASGNPVDLSADVLAGAGVSLRIIEALSFGVVAPSAVSAVIHNAATGVIRADIGASTTQTPGVFLGQCAVEYPPGTYSRIVEFYLIVDRGLFGTVENVGPPSMAEIRAFLRDNAPEDNYLDKVEFDLTEIALAIVRPVQIWNETPPPIQRATTSTFHYRSAWLDGICSELLRISAAWYRRNRLAYSAAGVSLDDRNRASEYDAAGAALDQRFREFVRLKKIQINVHGFIGGIGSPYGNGRGGW